MNSYLFVCSANMLRSPTAEHVARSMGYSADSAGSEPSYSPIRPLTVEAIDRAENIVCMEQRHADAVLALRPEAAGRIQVWNVPDDFDYCHPELMAWIKRCLPSRTYEPMRSALTQFEEPKP